MGSNIPSSFNVSASSCSFGWSICLRGWNGLGAILSTGMFLYARPMSCTTDFSASSSTSGNTFESASCVDVGVSGLIIGNILFNARFFFGMLCLPSCLSTHLLACLLLFQGCLVQLEQPLVSLHRRRHATPLRLAEQLDVESPVLEGKAAGWVREHHVRPIVDGFLIGDPLVNGGVEIGKVEVRVLPVDIREEILADKPHHILVRGIADAREQYTGYPELPVGPLCLYDCPHQLDHALH